MTKKITPRSQPNAWHNLKKYTAARIALGSAGSSLPTSAHLAFQLAHAQARDSVDIPLDFSLLQQQLASLNLKTLLLESQADNHRVYLQRPDKGRLLSDHAANQLNAQSIENPPDIALIIVDGLSSKAIANHAAAFMQLLLPHLLEQHYSITPVCLVKHGRVAIGDPISERLAARMTVLLIGERPGLSSPDSMGIYFTYQARSGKTDAERNCISNIHHQGIGYDEAVNHLLFLIREADRLKLSGVHLQDDSLADDSTLLDNSGTNFLLE